MLGGSENPISALPTVPREAVPGEGGSQGRKEEAGHAPSWLLPASGSNAPTSLLPCDSNNSLPGQQWGPVCHSPNSYRANLVDISPS